MKSSPRYVFVYGTLRQGQSNDINRYRPVPRYQGQAFIAGTLYDLGPYPGLILGGLGLVKGEVYEITLDLEAQLDRLEDVAPSSSGEYERRFVEISLLDRQVRCLVYEINPDFVRGRRSIPSGDWLCRV